MYCDVILKGVRATILTVSITYSECVSVAVVTQVCKAHAPHIMMMCGPSGCKVFFHLSHKRHDFRWGGGVTIERKACVLVFSSTFV